MINKILKDIDNEECYYVGTNGCLYQDLDKEELLAIKQEIERLNNIIKKYEKMSFVHEIDLQNRINKAIEYMQNIHWFDLRNNEDLQLYGTTENFYNDLSNILKGSGKDE